MAKKRGIDLVRIGGVQIAIDFSWIVVFLLVLTSLSAGYFPRSYPGYGWLAYLVVGVVATLLFFLSVVVHELAHALVANRSGQSVRRITLFIFGGMAHLTREPRDPIVELKIAAVGPLTSLAVGGAFWLLASWFGGAGAESLWAAMLNYLGFINVALALFNLLPGFPLDGGRILRAVLWFRSKDLRRATASAARSGSAIGFGLMLFGVFEIFSGALVGGLWLILIGMFLRGAAGASYQSLIVEQVLSSAPVRDLMVSNPVVVPSEISVRQAIEDHFLRYGFGGFPVARNGDIEGIVSLREVKDCPAEKRDERRVRDIMVAANARVTIPAAASAADALKQMTETESGRLLVVDEGRPVGLVTQTGIARFIQIQRLLEEGEAGEI